MNCVNLNEIAQFMKVALIPGEIVSVKIVREGRDKGQGIAYLPDGTMIIVNNALAHIGRQVDAEVQSTLQTGAGVIIFAEAKPATAIV